MTTATDTQNEQEYIPYGDDWAREMKRWKKDQLIDLLARCLKEHQRLRAALEGMVLGPAGRPTDLNA